MSHKNVVFSAYVSDFKCAEPAQTQGGPGKVCKQHTQRSCCSGRRAPGRLGAAGPLHQGPHRSCEELCGTYIRESPDLGSQDPRPSPGFVPFCVARGDNHPLKAGIVFLVALQMRKLRPRESRPLSKGHPADEGQNGDSDSGPGGLRP